MTESSQQYLHLGWREWFALPALGIDLIKAKIDTGARSSALHTETIELYQKNDENWLMFTVQSRQNQNDKIIECHAPIKDRRLVSDSGGHKQRRYVIETHLLCGQHLIQAEITLTNRDSMRFPMLLGRTALHKRQVLINPNESYLQGKPNLVSYNAIPK